MSWKTEALLCTSSPLHIYNRGVNSDPIFRVESDYAFAMELMLQVLPQYDLDLLLYTLMPNHYHFTIQQHKAYEVSNFINRVFWRYVKFFNKKYRRHGPLFSGRFHPLIVNDDVGLLRLSYYIHMNPVKAGLVKDPIKWRYGSCREYLQEYPLDGMLHMGPVLDLVGGLDEYKRFLTEFDAGDGMFVSRFLKNRNAKP